MLTSLHQGFDCCMFEMPCLLQGREPCSSGKSVSLDRALSDLTVKPYILSNQSDRHGAKVLDLGLPFLHDRKTAVLCLEFLWRTFRHAYAVLCKLFKCKLHLCQ